MLQAARRVPGLLRTWAGLGASPVRQFAGAAPQQPKEEDPLDDFQLLPPGCSLKDPTYGRSFGADRNSMSDPVVNYDARPVEEYRPLKKKQAVPAAPLNVAAAQAALDEKKVAAEAARKEEDEEELYVYVPPGSSMRDPLPSSLSDPLDNRRVYYRDPPKRK